MTTDNTGIMVTPEILTEKAAQIAERLEKIQQYLDILSQTVARSGGYWIGEAGDLHRGMYEEKKPLIKEIMHRLQEHPRQLCRMAGVYMDAEDTVRRTAEMLPDDILK